MSRTQNTVTMYLQIPEGLVKHMNEILDQGHYKDPDDFVSSAIRNEIRRNEVHEHKKSPAKS